MWLRVQSNEGTHSWELTVNVLILVRYSMPPGISTTSLRAPCPFCKGQCSGSNTCRDPSAPLVFLLLLPHPFLPQQLPLPCPLHGTVLPKLLLSPVSMSSPELPLSHCRWHLQQRLFPLPFPAPPYQQCLHLHGEGQVPPAPVQEVLAQVALADLGYICRKRKKLRVLSQTELNIVSCGVGSSWLVEFNPWSHCKGT